MNAPQEPSLTERMTHRFHLGCLATLLPYELRPAAPEAWLTVDRALFFLGHDMPPPVLESVLDRGSGRLRAALAAAVRDPKTHDGLIDLDDPDVHARLIDNHQLGYEQECRLRLRSPAAVAAGRWYHERNRRRALLSADPDLAAAALIDQRGECEPTARATAWATVRRHGGTARLRHLVAALPERPDPVSAAVVAACGQADPEPHLDTVEDSWLGTGALLRRLRAVRQPDEQRTARAAVGPGPALPDRLAADRGGPARPPAPAPCGARLLARPDCPPEVAVVLRTGRPVRPGRPLPAPAGVPATPAPGSGSRRRPPWVPAWRPPGRPDRSGRAPSRRAGHRGRRRSPTGDRTDRPWTTSRRRSNAGSSRRPRRWR
ncbi:hypothetical protein ACLGI4_01580 [Streptomyces sp. HMX112]|uniref:hypothetical protein n=1 Tax=Streptomyces sp. HMX112 TaxID=3390850 RepID=UPI003A80D15A